MRLRRLSFISGAIALAVAVPGAASSADPGAAEREHHARERAAAQLEALADERGALGTYLDIDDDQLVVVLPRKGEGRLTAADAKNLGVNARVEVRDIDRTTIDRVEAALINLRPTIPGQHGSSVAFNPETGLIDVVSDAPRSFFAGVEKAFPGRVSFLEGKVGNTAGNWNSDTVPHWGGASLNGALSCTSGFAVRDWDNIKYMVTAGHCNPHNTVTNMGTVTRHSDTYPGLDIELVRGKAYAGYVYADGATYEREVRDATNPVVGSSYCRTGRTTGFTCSWVVKAKGVKVCYPKLPSCTYNLFKIKRGDSPPQPGDSGGPMYIKAANLGVGIRGITSGQGWNPIDGWHGYVQGGFDILDWYRFRVVVP